MPPSNKLARVRVIEALRPGGVASRAELVDATGLSRVTVSAALAALRAEGFVVEEPSAREGISSLGRGRPPTVFRYNSAARAALGIAFDNDGVRAAVADLSLDVIAEAHSRFDARASSFEHVLKAARAAIVDVVTASGIPLERLRGAGVTIPLPIDFAADRIAAPRIMPLWQGVHPQHVFAELTGLPTHVENDANAAAVAELRWGAARDVSDFIYVKISPGVGGAIVSGGRLYRGAAGFAGEIGHIRAHEHGAICGCGNRGCLGPALSESLLEPAAARDASYQLGRALANLSNVLNPAAIVLGNVPAGARDVVVAAIHEAIDDYALRPIAKTLSVRLAELDERAGLLGALALAPVGYG